MPNITKIEFVFQKNKLIEKIIYFFSLLKFVKPILMPIVWFDDEARLIPNIHSELTTLIEFLNIANYIKFILPSISFLFILISSMYIFIQVSFQFCELVDVFKRIIF
jgi:hypothetical protein